MASPSASKQKWEACVSVYLMQGAICVVSDPHGFFALHDIAMGAKLVMLLWGRASLYNDKTVTVWMNRLKRQTAVVAHEVSQAEEVGFANRSERDGGN